MDVKRNSRKSRKCKSITKNREFTKKFLLIAKEAKEKRRKGKAHPQLPASLIKAIDLGNISQPNQVEECERQNDIVGNDIYEYNNPVSKLKNSRQFDCDETLEYKFPDKFEDEDIPSDNDCTSRAQDNPKFLRNHRLQNLDNEEQDDDDTPDMKHLRMLQGITSIPPVDFEGAAKGNIVMNEAYPESEHNPTQEILDGTANITVEDLLEGIQNKSIYSQLRKRTDQINRVATHLHPPLPKAAQSLVERSAAYEISKKEITKWEPLVKRNREASTIVFDKDIDLKFSTVGAIASDFKPRTKFEKNIATLVNDQKIVEAHKKDGAKLLEFNKVSVEDYKKRRDHVAKMRSLLFLHEVKMKHIKRIKSKAYHRLTKRRSNSESTGTHLDPEAAIELARKAEFKRAEERLTLRHVKSKWSKRILERGLNVQDDGTKAARDEQLQQHTLLTRKMRSMNDGSSDNESSDDDITEIGSDPRSDTIDLLEKARTETLNVLKRNEEVPPSGILSLPFMVRGMNKKKEAVADEARILMQDYELSLQQVEGTDGGGKEELIGTGRRSFGAARSRDEKNNNAISNTVSHNDVDNEFGAGQECGMTSRSCMESDTWSNSLLLKQSSEQCPNSTTEELGDFVSSTGTRETQETSISIPVACTEEAEESDANSEDDDTNIPSDPCGSRATYHIPSQKELIREAFAADGVEDEFAKDKEEVLNEENPDPEKPMQLPGWGTWTSIQKKKGLPEWMLREHEIAKRKREEDIQKRRDARTKHIIISEKVDKKAEKLHTRTLPHPFTSKDIFEQSIRVPIGPESNPASSVGVINRPEVVKKSGFIIKPIKFEDMAPSDEGGDKNLRKKQRKRAESKKDTSIVVKKS